MGSDCSSLSCYNQVQQNENEVIKNVKISNPFKDIGKDSVINSFKPSQFEEQDLESAFKTRSAQSSDKLTPFKSIH